MKKARRGLRREGPGDRLGMQLKCVALIPTFLDSGSFLVDLGVQESRTRAQRECMETRQNIE